MSSMGKIAAPEAPLLAEQLLAVDGGLEITFWKGVSVATVRKYCRLPKARVKG